MMIRGFVAAPLTVVVCLGICAHVQGRIDGIREEQSADDVLYLPNHRLLNHFTGGMSSIISDFLWLRTIQYVVAEWHSPEKKMTWLEEMCRTVTRLDPYFEGAYTYGGMLLAAVGADEKALHHLKQGAVDNPYSWEIPFEISKIYMLNRRLEPESVPLATHYLTMVAERVEEPEFFMDWVQRLKLKGNLEDEAREIWANVIRRNDDPFILELARAKLKDLDIRENIKILARATDEFQRQFGRSSASILELERVGLLSGFERRDDQGRYFLDREGAPHNTILLNQFQNHLAALLTGQMRVFHSKMQRYPHSLEEWAEWSGRRVPPHPYEDKSWGYDPATGVVN